MGGAPPPSQDSSFFSDWFDMVSQTQGQQPHWITPLATTTPRLEQEFRYDIQWHLTTAESLRTTLV
jgi:hypothetical protein